MAVDPVIIISRRKAISANAGGRSNYQAAIQGDARTVVTSPFGDERLYAKMYYFHRVPNSIDADNLS